MILITGPGGSGQSYFMQWINGLLTMDYVDRVQFLQTNNIITNCIFNKDKLKHLESPDILNVKIEKCIFIYNNPQLSIMSHFKQNWADRACRNLGNPFDLPNDILKNYEYYKNSTKLYGCDIFGIENQFNNWTQKAKPFPVLFLDFNQILDKKYILENFIQKNLDFQSFAYRKRLSRNDTDGVYANIYNNLYAKMLSFSGHIL